MKLEEIIAKIEELPTPDPIVQKIIAVASDPNASAKDLAEVIKLDPSLSVRVLRLVNSAYYGLPRKIAQLSEAVMILGFKTVRNLALSVFTYSSLMRRKRSTIDHTELWKHFIGVAVASELMAQVVGYPNKEELFIAGLLHDIGKVTLEFVSPEMFAAVAKLTKTLKISFFEAEKKLNLPNHALISMKTIERWGLPELVSQSCGGHHTPESFSESLYSDVISMIHVSDFFVNTINYGESYSYGGFVLSPYALNLLGLKPRMLTNYLKKLKEKLMTADEFLKIEQEAVS
ncbi:HDOD domain-containing protein [Pseudothermotoga sp.]